MKKLLIFIMVMASGKTIQLSGNLIAKASQKHHQKVNKVNGK